LGILSKQRSTRGLDGLAYETVGMGGSAALNILDRDGDFSRFPISMDNRLQRFEGGIEVVFLRC
jgi:hypothetical protein